MSEWVLEVDENKNILEAKWVQELVRCKDCACSDEYDNEYGDLWCNKFNRDVRPSGFCSNGERKDDENYRN